MLEAEIVAMTHGYVCRYYPKAMSGPVFRWKDIGDDSPGLLQVSAGREGVSMDGHSGTMRGGLERLLAVLQLAERVYLVLTRNDRDTDIARRIIKMDAPSETPA